jgi:predicted MFS family arabinose efflux permease
MAVSLGILGAYANLPLSFLLFSAYFTADSMATPTEMALATDAVSRSYWGRAQSLRVMGFQLLSAGGSILAGIMILRIGYAPTFGAAALLVLGSAIILLAKFGWSYRETEGGTFS